MAEPAQDHLIFLLVLVSIGIFSLAVFSILFFFFYQKRILQLQQTEQNREIEFNEELIRRQLESQEKERVRIAADLHDSLGSLLWGAKINASYIDRQIRLTGEEKQSHLELIEILDQSIATVRRIAWELSPSAFQQAGLSQSLKKLCERIEDKPLKVFFSEENPKFWNSMNALQVYRIIQELINNCIKHSRATRLTVQLVWGVDRLKILVEDDGIGFALDEVQMGMGWLNIKQRANQVKGEIVTGKSNTGIGFRIDLSVPLL